DFYPTFESCNEVTSKVESQNCFTDKIKMAVLDELKGKTLIRSNPKADTIQLQLHIDQNGNTQLTNISISETTASKNPELQNWLRHTIQNLPKAYPAQKRSVPVNLDVKLPIVLK
ncbi:MAG: hypothetical protein ABR595_06085, partial [Psychroflexus sp.]